MNKQKFLFPQSSFSVIGTPENTAFNEKLQ